jgi:hypothetical protein
MSKQKRVSIVSMMLIVLCFTGGLLFASGTEWTGALKGLQKPDMVAVQGNQFYVIEGAEIYVYSLRDLRLLRQFGERGYGPGQLRVPPEGANIIRLTPEYLLAEGRRKMIFFSKNG